MIFVVVVVVVVIVVFLHMDLWCNVVTHHNLSLRSSKRKQKRRRLKADLGPKKVKLGGHVMNWRG